MSNFRAIATATATLKELLLAALNNDGLNTAGTADIISVMRPDMAEKHFHDPGVNIYLYQVTPNAALRNDDLPTRRADGTILQRPLAALDLHYMISFYSPADEFIPQLLLGSVARTLQTEPQLTRARIGSTIVNPLYSSFLNVAGSVSNLADQVELVKFTPMHLSLEELAKIWSVFYQIPYVLSAAYLGRVVLIESDDTPQKALPVRSRNIYVEPFNQPVVEQIVEQAKVNRSDQPDPPITLGSTLLILGRQLRTPAGSGATTIRINGLDVTPLPQNVSNTQITLPLTDDPTQSDLQTANLRAGVQGVQVIHPRMMGTPPVPHSGVESNVAAFVLRPIIILPISPFPATGNGDTTLTVRPFISRRQQVVLLLNEIRPKPDQPLDYPPHIYSFKADPTKQTWLDTNGNVVTDPKKFSDNDTTDNIVFTISGVQLGTYLIRVQVDGAESPLDVDTDPKSPTFNLYTGTPQVTIP